MLLLLSSLCRFFLLFLILVKASSIFEFLLLVVLHQRESGLYGKSFYIHLEVPNSNHI